MKRNKKSNQDPTIRELDEIKRLLMLLLLKSGASQREIAKAIGMDQGNFSRAYPIGRVNRFADR
jgi:DNA-directed RNA polymerase specialized sigma subunit